jgi:hypothetical protein
MKALQGISISLVSALFFFSACGGEKETAEEIFMKKLAKNWQMKAADYKGKDVAISFPGLAINIGTAKAIIAQNAVPPMWKSASTFTLLEDGNSFMLNRNDGLVITVDELTETRLVLSFLFDAAALSGRTSSVKGEFVFEFEAD